MTKHRLAKIAAITKDLLLWPWRLYLSIRARRTRTFVPIQIAKRIALWEPFCSICGNHLNVDLMRAARVGCEWLFSTACCGCGATIDGKEEILRPVWRKRRSVI